MALTKKQKAIVSKWVKALHSGKYTQGKRKLHYKYRGTDKYCCLGVLCDLAVKAKVIPAPEKSGTTFLYDDNDGSLTAPVMEWAGLADATGDFIGGSLAAMNDDGKKFSTIAKIIESKPDGLFV
jgi:hypothetical protein